MKLSEILDIREGQLFLIDGYEEIKFIVANDKLEIFSGGDIEELQRLQLENELLRGLRSIKPIKRCEITKEEREFLKHFKNLETIIIDSKSINNLETLYIYSKHGYVSRCLIVLNKEIDLKFLGIERDVEYTREDLGL